MYVIPGKINMARSENQPILYVCETGHSKLRMEWNEKSKLHKENK